MTAAADCPTNNCDRGLVSWAYYNTLYPNTTTTQSIIWDATQAIPEVCYGTATVGTGPCGGTEYSTHVKLPDTNGYSDAPIFDDLFNCNLPQVSWVIPDGIWSDHPIDNSTATTVVYGPSWVGDIIDAVGGGMTGSTCNAPGSGRYWTTEPTLVLVVWDDWGGWFDHVSPPNVYRSSSSASCPTTDAPNGWGCGYVYGFRVPFLVVSPYTKAGYVSGACSLSCPNTNRIFTHDFGSILSLIEYNFNMPKIDQADKGYADYNALDAISGNIPLSDFFSLSNQRSFTNITTTTPFTCFQTAHTCLPNWAPTAPDSD